jgi:N-acetylmuramoyl-L-alanine amidase
MLSSPAFAAKFESWRFDTNQNHLEINTSSAVQPQAQLIFNPTRLVIDLPGTELGRPSVTQQIGGKIRTIRIGQFDDQTTRLVIELAPGYTFNPKQVNCDCTARTIWYHWDAACHDRIIDPALSLTVECVITGRIS